MLKLIDRYLKAGVRIGGVAYPTAQGTPQGGPLSNLLRDRLDRELERRGHRVVRYADDCHIYVRSAKAGPRVLASLTRYLSVHLKLNVNETKSAVDRPWKRKFLGFNFTVRRLTRRTRGVSLARMIEELKRYLKGWKAYFGFAEVQSPLRELDKWISRRLRSYLGKQWGRRRYRALKARGVSRELAWNTVKSAYGPW